jgi:hypothetical protein
MERSIVNAGLSQIFKIAEALDVPAKALCDFEIEEH